MFEKLSSNVNLLMNEMHISAEELARRTNIPASTIKKIRNQDSANPTLATLLPLAEFFSLSLGQLTGDEPMPTHRNKGSYQATKQNLQQIPILSWQDAANFKSALSKADKFANSEHSFSKNAYALLVEEDNWENLSLGTTLIVDPELNAEHRDFIVVCKKGQAQATVRQVFKDDGMLYLKPLVQGYQVAALTDEHIILGVVVEYKKYIKQTTALA